MNMKTIILNPEETLRLDYEHNWKDLVRFEDYLSIINQRKQFRLNERGIETNRDNK